ncbi:hypothetical protein ACLFLC_14805 [Providencia rettgeri]|uniref:hypothetical protein n=1 Tax=Providencia sp. PROV146 TaxID=2949856 RepID=UPI00234ADD95|nr:hypothetical protein [Providencia sp. PROV146]
MEIEGKRKPSLDDIKLSIADNETLKGGVNCEVSDNGNTKTFVTTPDGVYVTKDTDVKDDQQNSIMHQEVQDRIADRALRERFGDKAYNVVRKTLYGWAVVLAATGFCKFFFDKDLFSENVLIAITSAVTLNTFAAFLGVIRGLFPSNRKINIDDGK